jgi:hypothetical protein
VDTEQLIAFRLRQRLGELDNALVKRVEDALTSDLAEQLRKNDARQSQFSEFLNTALQAPSAPIVAEWVRYQMGRGATRRQWHDSGLGQVVLDDIAGLKDDATHMAGRIYPSDQREQGLRIVWIELVRRYAGWLRRRFVATIGGEADDEQ